MSDKNSYTVDRIMVLKPCYTHERVTSLWNGREALSAREIADLDIPVKDRIWCLVRLLPARELAVLWACDVAERAWQAHGNGDLRPAAAIDAARRRTRGEATEAECRQAAAAAFTAADAAYAANAAAAYAAAAAAFAADAAAFAASAYAFAADAAAFANAANATNNERVERAHQLESLVTLLEGEER